MKRCSLCKIEKLHSEFYRDVDHNDGLRSRCKSCLSGVESARKRNSGYFASEKYRSQRRARDRALYAAARSIGPEHPGYWRYTYQRRTPDRQRYERKLFLNRRRLALKKGAAGCYEQAEWEALKRRYGFTCPACLRVEPAIVLTVDHVVPLSKGGSNNIENIQPLCRACNSRKHTETFLYPIPNLLAA
jgi:5-methylcytosine-specific restriction endonuclease McrA